nr:DNA translocase FtsK [Microvirga thermotolerans]
MADRISSDRTLSDGPEGAVPAAHPAWWQAFVVAGATCTRTPDKFLRDRGGRTGAGPGKGAPPSAEPAGDVANTDRAGNRAGADVPEVRRRMASLLATYPSGAVEEPRGDARPDRVAESQPDAIDAGVAAETAGAVESHAVSPDETVEKPVAAAGPVPTISPQVVFTAWAYSYYTTGEVRFAVQDAPDPAEAENAALDPVEPEPPASPGNEPREGLDIDPAYLLLYQDELPSMDRRPAPPAVQAAAAAPERALPASTARAPVPVVEPAASTPVPASIPSEAGAHPAMPRETYELPELSYLALPPERQEPVLTEDILEETAGRLEKIIRDFGVKGDVIHVHPGPVVTLYELEPAPGTKSSRVIALSDDIARSMSATSARVAVIPGRNAIGIELPNQVRETVFLRELLASHDFETSQHKLPLCLGKTIGGEPVIADLARMPHLLVAGTTGSGKSVAINTMILSLLYRFRPDQCRLIMVDPKMLELSVYDGIPHLLTPVVTDPKKAIIALRWAVREMEDRYKKMSKLGVRNIDGFNARVSEAKARGEVITRTVQTGFDRETGQAVYEDEVMDLEPLPYIVVIVDEMADLMMVAGKEIEGAIQRLAQMARAAGIHVILATQRPSVDVITGTIKANFPTRISFQVTSKIDSRTILGEMGAEQLLGQGDMLYMAGGGRITRVHGPFCSDEEVEKVVAHLKRQGRPQYLEAVTADEDEGGAGGDSPVFDQGEFGAPGGDLYEQAVSIVLRHRKASTSYIQRRLQIGYNRAASLMERMEKEGIVGPANHAGKREILLETPDQHV